MFTFHVDFSLPMLPLLSKPLYISMRRRKMYFLVHKVIRNRSIWGPCQFFFYHQTPCEFFTYLSVWKHERIYMEEHMEKWRICMEHVKDFFKKKWKTIWKNAKFDWKSERISMTRNWKSEEFVWKHEGFIKKKWRISMEKWRIRLDKRKDLYGPTVF